MLIDVLIWVWFGAHSLALVVGCLLFWFYSVLFWFWFLLGLIVARFKLVCHFRLWCLVLRVSWLVGVLVMVAWVIVFCYLCDYGFVWADLVVCLVLASFAVCGVCLISWVLFLLNCFGVRFVGWCMFVWVFCLGLHLIAYLCFCLIVSWLGFVWLFWIGLVVGCFLKCVCFSIGGLCACRFVVWLTWQIIVLLLSLFFNFYLFDWFVWAVLTFCLCMLWFDFLLVAWFECLLVFVVLIDVVLVGLVYFPVCDLFGFVVCVVWLLICQFSALLVCCFVFSFKWSCGFSWLVYGVVLFVYFAGWVFVFDFLGLLLLFRFDVLI